MYRSCGCEIGKDCDTVSVCTMNNAIEEALEVRLDGYLREPKKMRTRSELEKSCRGLREHNAALKAAIDRIRELPFEITDDEPSRIKMAELIESKIRQ